MVIIIIAIVHMTGCSIKKSPDQTLENLSAKRKETVVGEYLLQDVMETGSGLLLSENGTYKFYIAYGCLDELDSGQWHIEDSSVILKSSTARKDPQFTFIRSSQEKFDSVRISFKGEHSRLATYLTTNILYSNSHTFNANEIHDSYAHSRNAVAPIQKVSLSFMGILRVYPEYDYEPINPNNNHFVFEASKGNYGNVCFDSVKLKIGKGELNLELPGMQREFSYVRFKNK